jgi:peptidase M1-like protein
MNRVTALALLLAVGTFGMSAAPGIPPSAAAATPASFRVEPSYVLRSSLNYGTGTISTSEKITIRNRSGVSISSTNLSVMPRAFGELVSLSDLRLDGARVTGSWTNSSNLRVEFGRSVAPDTRTVLTLSFVVRANGTIGTSLEGRLSKANGIMQVAHWFPIVSNGHGTRYPGDSQSTRAARKIRAEITTESTSVQIAAPGTRVSRVGRTQIYEIESARDFAFSASPNYKSVLGSAAGVTVRVYYTTGDGPSALKHGMSALAKFESVFGAYQWPRFVVAQTGRKGSGNEYPGIVFLGSAVMADRETVAHETAHQWWYAMAGNDQIAEPWLDEGISEFAASYFYGGFDAYSSSKPVNSSVYAFPNLPAPTTSDDPGSYTQTIYYKSAAFLNGLRSRMGNTAFFGGLRDLFNANRNGMMTTREFYDAMARRGASTTYMRQFIAL